MNLSVCYDICVVRSELYNMKASYIVCVQEQKYHLIEFSIIYLYILGSFNSQPYYCK